jgi:hypothetical protein
MEARVSETNRKREYPTRQLYAAALALVEYGKATKPELTQKGRNPPAIPPLPGELGLRLAYCRNSLEAVAKEYETKQEEARDQHTPDTLPKDATADQRMAWAQAQRTASKALDGELRSLAEVPREWHPPATLRLQQLLDRSIPEEWLAAWLAVGIIVGEPGDLDAPAKDAKP